MFPLPSPKSSAPSLSVLNLSFSIFEMRYVNRNKMMNGVCCGFKTSSMHQRRVRENGILLKLLVSTEAY